MTGFDVKCQGEVSGEEWLCSREQGKLRVLLFQNHLTFFMWIIK